MIKIQDTVLVIRNARDKIQVANYVLWQDGNNFLIKRYTGQHDGKFTEQPEVKIEKGKAKRTVLQQAELEYNSILNKSADKGYKKLTDLTKTKYDEITSVELDRIVPSIKTDAAGNKKPQLAKSYKDCTLNIWEKPMWCSRKIDGTRCMMAYDKETKSIYTISRGGKDYDPSTTSLRNNKSLLKFFEDYPDCILDGELYIFGWPLQLISGLTRLRTWEEKCDQLEYWIYDIGDDTKSFSERLDVILFRLSDYVEEEEKIKLVEHKLLTGWDSVKKYHDKWVAEGFEGLVARKSDKKYEFGKKNSNWIKVKDRTDDEFIITGIRENMRDEDMCFILETKEGREFDAKPMGDRNLKKYYLENRDSIIGKMGTVVFRDYSMDGKPKEAVFKCVREKGE